MSTERVSPAEHEPCLINYPGAPANGIPCCEGCVCTCGSAFPLPCECLLNRTPAEASESQKPALNPGETIGGRWQIGELLAYQGKDGCTDPRCTRGSDKTCIGYHCPTCDASVSMMGHKCPANADQT